jgi:Sulfotransferase domain
MMRSWGNRPDTIVCDEPLYAHYLHVTGREHPGAGEVVAAGETDVKKVVEWLLGPVPGGRAVFYQKHMAHHLLGDVPREWLRHVTNCFLIREPREVLTSLVKHVPDATLADTGYPQQAEIFELVERWTGRTPPVVDARDVLDNPRRVLGRLCEALDLTFTEAMLAWAPGLRETDGVWAKYWYKEVETTTSFRPYKPKDEPVPDHMSEMLQTCERHYERLHRHRIV